MRSDRSGISVRFTTAPPDSSTCRYKALKTDQSHFLSECSKAHDDRPHKCLSSWSCRLSAVARQAIMMLLSLSNLAKEICQPASGKEVALQFPLVEIIHTL